MFGNKSYVNIYFSSIPKLKRSQPVRGSIK